MIDNLIGLCRTLFNRMGAQAPAGEVAMLASRLVEADMGAAAVQRHMPEAYHKAVNEAKKFLRDHDDWVASLT